MAPREKALGKPAKAPPKTNPKKRTFGRFREKRFLKALELTKEFYKMKELQRVTKKGSDETIDEKWADAGWGVIVGSQKVHDRLAEEGIKSTLNPLVAYDNEIILNRGKERAESNFFVFIKFGNFRTAALFTDPSSGEGGRALDKKQLTRIRRTWRSKGDWTAKTVEEIKRVAERKGKHSFYSVLHGHWGENSGHDDGISPRRDVIREFMRYHYDVDATGYHNWIDQNVTLDIMRTERELGITKVPSTEYTYLFHEAEGDNGPHFNLWFADMETAMDFHGRYLEGKAKKMPGMAPSGQKGVDRYIRRKRQEKKMALGVAHPSCLLNLGRKRRLPVGLINQLNLKDKNGEYYKWRFIVSFVRRMADGVGAFNPTVGGYEVKFKDGGIQEKMKKLIGQLVSRYIGGEANMDENNINMAFAAAMKHDERKFAYFDHDTHTYMPSKYYFRTISPLAYGRTVFHMDKDSFRMFQEKGELTSEDVIRLMRKSSEKVPGEDEDGALEKIRKRRQLSEEDARKAMAKKDAYIEGMKISMDTFLELKPDGAVDAVTERRDQVRKLVKAPSEVKKGIVYVKLAWEEWKRRTRSMWQP